MTGSLDIAHVLFDLDGTLVDSKSAILGGYRHAFATVAGLDGFPGPEVDVSELLKKRLEETFADHGFADHAAKGAVAYDGWYRTHGTPLVRVYPTAIELLDGLDAAGIAYGIVTNKGLGRTLGDLRHVGIAPQRLRVIVTAEDTPERKPHPAPILLGLERLGADPARTLYVGDGPHDVLAAQAAGLRAVAAAYGYYSRAQLDAVAPDLMLDRPLDLLASMSAAAVGVGEGRAVA